MAQQRISAAEFERMRDEGKLDPRTNPRLAAAAAQLKKPASNSAEADAYAETVDIAGYQCRPLDLSTLMLLQRAGSPLVTGEPSNDPVSDAMAALWLMSGPEAEVLRTVRDKDELWEAAFMFAKGVTPAKAREITSALQSYLDRVAAEMSGGEAGEKKVAAETGNGLPA